MENINMKALVNKWGELLKEGKQIANDKVAASTALMLENQHKYLVEQGFINETNTTGASLGTNYNTSGVFHKIAVPMVRRTFPELVAHELVGVQPMAGPVGIAFALRFKSGQTYAGATGTELGYNNIDKSYAGPLPTATGEALGSNTVANVGTAPNDYPGTGGGLGIGTGAGAREINMTIEKAQVEAQTSKLKSRWSLEVAQDIRAMHNLDIEQEMLDILAYEITAEIDRVIADKIYTVAATNTESLTGANALDWTATTDFDGRWEHEKYRNLYNLSVRKANRIAISTRRGSANFILANPTVCAAFEASSAFTIAPVAANVNTSVTGVSKMGSLEGRLNLYRDTFATSDSFTLGYKGSSPFDAGIIYLPYIQLMVSKATYEDSFNPAVGVMTRYGLMDHMFGSKNYYLTVEITNMP